MTDINISIFFTRGVSLQTWANNGSLEREVALYLNLQKEKGVRVCFITYGDQTDLHYRTQMQGIEILCNRWNLPARIYEQLIPLLHARALFHTDLIKTNQTNGADIALLAARIWRKPLIARCGYMWSEFVEKEGSPAKLALVQRIENDVFSHSRNIVVTTPEMKHFIIENYGIASEKIRVIPNYVLTNVFSSKENEAVPNRITFVGRLAEQKNLFSLIDACAGLDIDLQFVGEGYLRGALEEKAKELGIQLTMSGNLPHHRLPQFIRQSALFALVSLYEGHPKSLLEAMACGVAVLGADSPGIREQIVHGETGWLVGTDAESIRAGIQHLIAHPQLRAYLGANARRFILENYSLDKIVETEYALYQEVL
jgi:glycosyltransferase involved in cell wall biosynthesis